MAGNSLSRAIRRIAIPWLLAVNHRSFLTASHEIDGLNRWDEFSLTGDMIHASPREKRPIAREKERCSGSFHLAVRFLVIKDDSISGLTG